jgi:hypothetical protein
MFFHAIRVLVLEKQAGIYTSKMLRSAVLSNCSEYRYRLYREWDIEMPTVLFIMLNPSSANGDTDDPTTRRVINFAKQWGYGKVYIGNLFPFICTDPQKYKIAQKKKSALVVAATERRNQIHVKAMCKKASRVIYAWGHNIRTPVWLEQLVHTPFCIALSKRQFPKHPLYLKKTLQPSKYFEKGVSSPSFASVY